MASVTLVDMTALSLLLGDFHLVVGRRIRRVNRYPLKACWSTVLTGIEQLCLYFQNLPQ